MVAPHQVMAPEHEGAALLPALLLALRHRELVAGQRAQERAAPAPEQTLQGAEDPHVRPEQGAHHTPPHTQPLVKHALLIQVGHLGRELGGGLPCIHCARVATSHKQQLRALSTESWQELVLEQYCQLVRAQSAYVT
eukprot:CAMPEP_0202867336 /NCGR_PEP_ID=MMETSP1391-20130828/9231_1 /ASSEMBLY_ACC=CAM_ASM_000867 /TAXON_ID=1034604 /ORGANISM="Chlamydomonas leiostraca, Strain SAG 11-49" /LENGTH=136 /DNA_ID=CAMNT_0049547375 /DNA_START=482 /DNA_END=892 /DNA_ORIENTATION=-